MAFALQNFQANMECCGWNGPSDYLNPKEIPASCCQDNYTLAHSLETCARLNVEYNAGCNDSSVINFVRSSFNYSANILIFVQVVIILSAFCLARYLKAYQPVNTSD